MIKKSSKDVTPANAKIHFTTLSYETRSNEAEITEIPYEAQSNYILSPYAAPFIRDKSVSIHHRNIQKVATEMFKVKNNLCPESIKNLFCLIETKTRSNASFRRPNVNTVYNGDQSLRSFGPIVWDAMLPQKFKTITDLEEFKKKIRAWTPDNCPCRLCKDYIANIGFITINE